MQRSAAPARPPPVAAGSCGPSAGRTVPAPSRRRSPRGGRLAAVVLVPRNPAEAHGTRDLAVSSTSQVVAAVKNLNVSQGERRAVSLVAARGRQTRSSQASRTRCAAVRAGTPPAGRKRSVNPVWTWERANRTLALSTASTGRCPLRREGPRTGSARCSTVLARLPQRRLPAGPNAYGWPKRWRRCATTIELERRCPDRRRQRRRGGRINSASGPGRSPPAWVASRRPDLYRASAPRPCRAPSSRGTSPVSSALARSKVTAGLPPGDCGGCELELSDLPPP